MRAVIFANGEINEISLVRELINKDDFIAAADGGFRFTRELKLNISMVIGDLDSISSEALEFIETNGIEIIKFPPEKDQTDLELAMLELSTRGYDQILVIGALGGRIDQTLANIGLISLFAQKGIRVELDDGQDHVVLVQDKYKISGKKGDTVSLMPIYSPVQGITTSGLAYSLDNEGLFPNQTRGISNVMTGTVAEIRITSGDLLCIHTRG